MLRAGDLFTGLLALGLTVLGSSSWCQTSNPAGPDEHQIFDVMMKAGAARTDIISTMDRMDGASTDQSTLPLRTCIHRLEFEASEIARLEQSVWEFVGIRDHMTEPVDRDYMTETVKKSSAQTSRLLAAAKTMDFDKTYQKCAAYPDFKSRASQVSDLYDQAQVLLTQLQAAASSSPDAP